MFRGLISNLFRIYILEKQYTMKARNILALALILFFTTSCDWLLGSPDDIVLDPTQEEAPDDTTTETLAGAESIDLIPVFSEGNPVARSVIPQDATIEEIFYSIFTPPLTRFADAPASLEVGDSLSATILGTSVTLTTSSRDGLIVFSGKLVEMASDGTSVETGAVEVVYNKPADSFTFHSEFLIVDPDNVLQSGTDFHAYTVVDIPETVINTDHSFLALGKTTAILMPGSMNELQYLDALELYSGTDDTGDSMVGFAIASFSDSEVADHVSLNAANFASMVDTAGLPLPTSDFQPIKEAILATRSVLDAAVSDNGAHMIGYKVTGDAGVATYLYNNPDSVTNGAHLVDSAGSRLKDSADVDIQFIVDTPESTMPSPKVSNVVKLVTGFPSAAWRTGSRLPEIYAAKSTYDDDR